MGQMKILLMGTPEFAVPTLDALLASSHELVGVITQPDAPAGRGRKLRPPPVKQRAVEAGVAVYQPQRPARELWPALSPDLIVVVAYGHILKSDLLDWPPLGCVNLHASLLPRHRGAAPIQWALIKGDKETGVTSMQMVEKLDAGDILLRRRCPISPDETAESLSEKLSGLAAAVCMETIDALGAEGAGRGGRGMLKPIPQDEALATYASKLKKEDAVLDWRREAADICRRVRGLRPWPVARTRWIARGGGGPAGESGGEHWLRVWMAAPESEETTEMERSGISVKSGDVSKVFSKADESTDYADDPDLKKPGDSVESMGVPPGSIGGLAKGPSGREGIRIAAADGWVLLTEVQPEGKRRMDAKAFWQGYRLPEGAVVG